jgi:hypothetical protein
VESIKLKGNVLRTTPLAAGKYAFRQAMLFHAAQPIDPFLAVFLIKRQTPARAWFYSFIAMRFYGACRYVRLLLFDLMISFMPMRVNTRSIFGSPEAFDAAQSTITFHSQKNLNDYYGSNATLSHISEKPQLKSTPEVTPMTRA